MVVSRHHLVVLTGASLLVPCVGCVRLATRLELPAILPNWTPTTVLAGTGLFAQQPFHKGHLICANSSGHAFVHNIWGWAGGGGGFKMVSVNTQGHNAEQVLSQHTSGHPGNLVALTIWV